MAQQPAGSCADPSRYPGFPLTSLDLWEKSCLPSPGNCAFRHYAANPGGRPGTITEDVCEDMSIKASIGHEVGGIKSVCFVNIRDPRDRLCIFQDFDVGNVNVEQMERGSLQKNLASLVGAVRQEMRLDSMRFCLHRGSHASVGWTHLHTFDRELPTPPDGIDATNAYCVDYRGSPEETAEALALEVTSGAAPKGTPSSRR